MSTKTLIPQRVPEKKLRMNHQKSVQKINFYDYLLHFDVQSV